MTNDTKKTIIYSAEDGVIRQYKHVKINCHKKVQPDDILNGKRPVGYRWILDPKGRIALVGLYWTEIFGPWELSDYDEYGRAHPYYICDACGRRTKDPGMYCECPDCPDPKHFKLIGYETHTYNECYDDSNDWRNL